MPDNSTRLITEGMPDSIYKELATEFATTCAASASQLGLTPANVSEISNAASAFSTSYTTLVTSQTVAAANRRAKDIQLASTRAVINKWAKMFRANPAISDQLLGTLHVAPHKTSGSKTPPTQPLDLIATASGTGTISLKWKRNGNRTGTVFVIESQGASGGEWLNIGSTTKSKFETQATIGQYVAYRVTAIRNDLTSQPSAPVTLWGTSGSNAAPTLKVA